jgi:hypothetical protein
MLVLEVRQDVAELLAILDLLMLWLSDDRVLHTTFDIRDYRTRLNRSMQFADDGCCYFPKDV